MKPTHAPSAYRHRFPSSLWMKREWVHGSHEIRSDSANRSILTSKDARSDAPGRPSTRGLAEGGAVIADQEVGSLILLGIGSASSRLRRSLAPRNLA